MALIAKYLIDTSAAARMHHQPVGDRLAPLIESGLVGTCAVLDAEALYSARGGADYESRRTHRRTAYEYLPTNDDHWHAALDAQRGLARVGQHRAVGIADLLTAVLAAEHHLTIIHYDADFETAATILDFDHAWVAKRGIF